MESAGALTHVAHMNLKKRKESSEQVLTFYCFILMDVHASQIKNAKGRPDVMENFLQSY